MTIHKGATVHRTPSSFLPSPTDSPDSRALALNSMANGIEESNIRMVAQEVRTLLDAGKTICNLSIGDFRPDSFPVPASFLEKMAAELRAGQTYYTPSDGIPDLKNTIADLYRKDLGIDFGSDSILVSSGARPAMFIVFSSILKPGDGFAFGVPSWNSQYYAYLTGSRALAIPCTAESRFLPDAENVARILPKTRLLLLNSPLNPTGTAYRAHELKAVCELVLEENLHRRARGKAPVMLVYDQVYRTLTHRDNPHVHPLGLVPELAPWTIYIDAISKSLAATGLRVGWAVVPPYLKTPFKSLLGHIGAFAPRPEQRATAWFLSNDTLRREHSRTMLTGIEQRLRCLVNGAARLAEKGLPVETIEPQGGIYLSIRFNLFGWTTASGNVLSTNESIRSLLLHEAGVALVPFQAFGLEEESGWFRMSAGAVSTGDLEAALQRMELALGKLGRPH